MLSHHCTVNSGNSEDQAWTSGKRATNQTRRSLHLILMRRRYLIVREINGKVLSSFWVLRRSFECFLSETIIKSSTNHVQELKPIQDSIKNKNNELEDPHR